ncbi:MAG: hypothetical protein P8M22_02290 [Phycisphaerales bacterium]|nr:hypothetical protein [Phycisphaerales bacterium]
MDKNKDTAKRLLEAARQAGDLGSPGNRLGQSILFMAKAATAMHVSLMGGNPAGTQGSEDRSS